MSTAFNMAIVSEVVMRLLTALRVPRRWAAAAGITVIVIYTLFVGVNTAVVRAAIMSSMLVIGTLFRRKTYVPASLAFVALLMSAVNPTVLWDVSFQLSLFAVLGLSLFVDPLSKIFDQALYWVFPRSTAASVSHFLAEPLIVTLAAQITTLPLIILYFGRLSLASVVVNLLIIPAQAPLLIIGGLATLLAWMPGVAQVLYWLDLILLSWTIGVVRLFAQLPFADVEFHVDPRLIALFFIILFGGALMRATQPSWALSLGRLIRQRAVSAATGVAGISIVVLLGAVILSRPDNRLHVWFLDVGHSNAVLVQTPRGAQMLIDAGRFPSRLLTALGDHLPFTDREIEVLVITQPDEFDTSALTAVLARYDVGVALTNGQPNLSDTSLQLQDMLTGHDVATVRTGYTLDTDDGVRLEVLHPQRQPTLDDSLDDNALTLRLSYSAVSFLLTSDLSQEGQAALLADGQWPLATVLQLPQHGTARSLDSTFIDAVQPQVVVIQSDPANRRGDPDPDVLALLSALPVFRTDQSGTIHFWTDGRALWVVEEG
jgi:competence protein ComEC